MKPPGGLGTNGTDLLTGGGKVVGGMVLGKMEATEMGTGMKRGMERE